MPSSRPRSGPGPERARRDVRSSRTRGRGASGSRAGSTGIRSPRGSRGIENYVGDRRINARREVRRTGGRFHAAPLDFKSTCGKWHCVPCIRGGGRHETLEFYGACVARFGWARARVASPERLARPTITAPRSQYCADDGTCRMGADPGGVGELREDSGGAKRQLHFRPIGGTDGEQAGCGFRRGVRRRSDGASMPATPERQSNAMRTKPCRTNLCCGACVVGDCCDDGDCITPKPALHNRARMR